MELYCCPVGKMSKNNIYSLDWGFHIEYQMTTRINGVLPHLGLCDIQHLSREHSYAFKIIPCNNK